MFAYDHLKYRGHKGWSPKKASRNKALMRNRMLAIISAVTMMAFVSASFATFQTVAIHSS